MFPCLHNISKTINENKIETLEITAEPNIPTHNRFKILSKLNEEPANHLESDLTPKPAALTASLVPASTTSNLEMPDFIFSESRPIVDSLNMDQLRCALGL